MMNALPDSTASPHPRLAFIGGGNMAQAIITGCLASKTLSAERIVVAEPDLSRHGALSLTGVTAVPSASEAVRWLHYHEAKHPDEPPGQILLAVKPQMLAPVASEVAAASEAGRRVVISILAGTPSAKVRSALGAAFAVVRAMPNTPAKIGKGVTALSLGAGALAGDELLARRLFRGIGPLVIDCDESLMDAFTAVGGSGPAYVFYLAEAMIAAAIELGFARETADQVVRATIAGAALLLLDDQLSPAELRAAVTSKGGTTAAATRVLDDSLVQQAIRQAIRAARDRGIELSRSV
ncbi:MAG: pyrroline-5-carboxylate reductase [Pyrinomonadaceae bacterium]|nr:pyrroline-5-carboxylate reductase [Phycisphaerales bacterium]